MRFVLLPQFLRSVAMVAKFSMRERKVSNFIFIIFSTYLIYIYLLLGPLQQDGRRL